MPERNNMTNADADFFLVKPASLQVQSVLYGNDFASVERAVMSLGRSVELAISVGMISRVELAYGDSSSIPCLTEEQLVRLRGLCPDALTIRYDFFNGNLGSARGHNRLAVPSDADFILVQNPDIVVSPRLIETLLGAFATPKVGMAEAKQLPIEHPKDYDQATGETSWATTAQRRRPACRSGHSSGSRRPKHRRPRSRSASPSRT